MKRIPMVLLLALVAGPAAHAADRCTAAAEPSDHIALDDCDTCAVAPTDRVVRTLERATEEGSIPLPNRKLAAITAKALRDALAKGYDVAKHFAVGDVGMIGAETGLSAVLADKQTDLQKKAAADGAIWLRHEIGAQAGANLGTTVPVGPDGFYVRTGVGAGATVKVTVDHEYDPRLASIAENATLNQLTIPYAAVDAEEMKPGERVVIAGNGNVAVYAESGYGINLGNVVPNVSAGASVGAGGTNVLSGAFETEVTREPNHIARVKLRTGWSDDAAAYGNLFAGISVNRDGFEIPVNTGVNVLDAALRSGRSAIAREAEKVVSASFVTRNGELHSTGDLQEYTFDLSRREARRAYEDALRGDFRAAGELAACGGAGVGFVSEVNDKVKTAYSTSKLSVSLLDYSVASSSSDAMKTIRDAAGTRRFDLFGYSYDRRTFFGSRESVNVGAVHSMTGELGDDGKSVHLTWDGSLENRWWTSTGEMKDLVHLGRSMAGGDVRAVAEMEKILKSPRAGANLPGFLNYYGHTRMKLDLVIAEKGIDRIASASNEDLWKAFADARRETPLWATPEGRRQMEEYDRFHSNDDRGGSGYTAERYWEGSWRRTSAAVAALDKLKTTDDESQRARLLRDAAEAMGDDFTAGAALAILSGEPARSVKFGIQNDHVDYTWTDVGEDSAIVAVH